MSRNLLQRSSKAALVAAAAMAQRRHVALAKSTAFKTAANSVNRAHADTTLRGADDDDAGFKTKNQF